MVNCQKLGILYCSQCHCLTDLADELARVTLTISLNTYIIVIVQTPTSQHVDVLATSVRQRLYETIVSEHNAGHLCKELFTTGVRYVGFVLNESPLELSHCIAYILCIAVLVFACD